MADWEADSPKLQSNLEIVFGWIAAWATDREHLDAELLKRWHRQMMEGLSVPDPKFVGCFRGEPGIERQQLFIGGREGTKASPVRKEVDSFIAGLRRGLNGLDALFPAGDDLDRDGLQAVIELAAWSHSEWVRIHLLGNGNGRSARMLANAILMRYGPPPVLRLRPRPSEPYAGAAAAGLDGDIEPLQRLLLGALISRPE